MIINNIKNRLFTKPSYNKQVTYIPVLSGHLLENRTILITGATGGLGYALSLACLRNGACIIIGGRDENKISDIRKKIIIESGVDDSKIYVIKVDLKYPENFKEELDKVLREKNIENIDTLINNAGIQTGNVFGETEIDSYDEVLTTNLRGTYFFSQVFSNYLIENNIQGNILNVSSSSGIRPAITPYMVSKWGINGITEGMAKKLIKYGIVVNGIAPGPTLTPMINNSNNGLRYDKAPSKRYCDPTEVANLAVVLISDMGRMVVGDTLYVTGGLGNLTVDDINY